MNGAMPTGAQKVLSMQPPSPQTAAPPCFADIGETRVNDGLTDTPALHNGGGRATVPPQPAAKVAVTSLRWLAGCSPSAVLGGNGDMRCSTGTSVLPPHLLVHPQGFRILKNTSVLERNMRTYFRLPRPLNAAACEERRRVRRTILSIEADEAKRRARVSGNQDGVVLDGFLILSACEADDPELVTQLTLHSSQLSSSVAEDLGYFTHLTSLDLTDNNLRLDHVLPFPGLEVVHLVCNNIMSLAEVSQLSSSSFSTIVALDLAYNRIPAHHISYLKAFGALRQLDISHNGLRTLPADLSGLAHLTHFALEANELSSADVFYALGTMPALVEVNLASNRLSFVPLLDAGSCNSDSDPQPTLFPSLEVVSLTANRFQHIEALRPLAALHRTLRRVAVGENPFLDSHPHRLMELQRALDEAVVDAYYVAFLSPQENSTASGELPEVMGTWRHQTWVRYIPQLQGEREISASHMVAAAAPLGASSSSHSSASAPQTAASNAMKDMGQDHSVNEDSLPEDVLPPLQTVMDYLNRYRVHVHPSRATPPHIPKQPKSYFYSSAFRQSEQGIRDLMPLVTLPSYNEFMDVYRVLGQGRPQPQGGARRGFVGRSAAAQRAATQSALSAQCAFIPTLPPLSDSLCMERPVSSHQASEENKTPPAAAAENARGGACFFLTDLDGDVVGNAEVLSRGHASKDRSPTPVTKLEEVQAELADRLPPAPSDSVDKSLPPSRRPRSVVFPATTNVHAAISELRDMLRKPLPLLPYKVSRSKQTTG
ncbi:hypothetical protein JKF63_02387 [Porcisia hertigi]|uniref:Uncharacterized protein n=1 Tax=Porcisia hertigi TaxID=2761500 RepID=A0A836HR43_9TRYP|nr:hypothetical protein JKF63_02387 [Porcisia hertigi]